jgi:acetyltransferase
VRSLPVLERLLDGTVPDGLLDAIVAVSRLAAEHPEVSEIDINPLLVSPERAVALDCLIVLTEKEPSA